jgi:hypothetical protein
VAAVDEELGLGEGIVHGDGAGASPYYYPAALEIARNCPFDAKISLAD